MVIFFHQTFTDVPNFLIFKHTIQVKPVCFSGLNALLTLETAADRQAYGQKTHSTHSLAEIPYKYYSIFFKCFFLNIECTLVNNYVR